MTDENKKLEDTPPAANNKADGGKTEDLAFMGRLEKAFSEALEIKFKAMETKVNEMIDAKLGEVQIEAERKLRAALGVEKDPVVHHSDLVAALRKAALEANGGKNQAPAATDKAGQNDKPEDPFEALEKAATAGAQ